MYFSNQTSINGVYLGNPLIYTGNQAKRSFSIANSLLEDVNIFDRQLPQIDYLFFSELRGKIKFVTDSIKELHYTMTPVDTRVEKRIYHFSKTKELLSIENKEGTYKEEVKISDSLKKRQKVTIIKSFDSKIHSVNEHFFDKTMEFIKFEEHILHSNEKRSNLNEYPRQQKYVYNNNNNVISQKIKFINDSKEQSKIRIYFNEDANINMVIAYDQREKQKILYQSLYQYNQANNIDTIIFKRFTESGSIAFIKEHKFKYDENDNLQATEFENYTYDKRGNLIKRIHYNNYSNTKAFEEISSYKYSCKGNWKRKTTKLFRYEGKIRTLIKKTKIKRKVNYY